MGVEQTKLHPKFKWHSFIYSVRQMTGRVDYEIYNMKYVEALSWVSFEQERQRVEVAIMKKQNRKR